MDMLESIPVPEDHPSRTSACAYRELREKATLSSSSAVSDVVLSHLPKAVSAVTGWRHIRLFNEHYILKPPKTVSEFRWHRDADLQLAACFVPSEYTSVWCALDAVHPHNGTLTLIPLSDVGAGETVGADVDNTDPTHDPCSAVTVTLSAGDAVVFDSAVWHRSGPNLSDSIRRVLYAQYSPGVVTTSGLKDDGGKPICFAVPCERE
jgi:ectoine hydroxylase-related dioxygenase (phytanoyl-CoA dioxygenase family)